MSVKSKIYIFSIKKDMSHPWASPGSAPIHGEGCGANGGNPNGCDGEGIQYPQAGWGFGKIAMYS